MSTLRRLRTNRLLTVDALSKETGVNARTIYLLEAGDTQNPRIDTIGRLASFFDVEPSLLVPGLSSKPEPESEAA